MNEESELRYTERVMTGERRKYMVYIEHRKDIPHGYPRVKFLRVLAMNKDEAKQFALDEWSSLLKYYDVKTIKVSKERRK